MTVRGWMCLVLFCLCCHLEIQPTACTPLWMKRKFPCDVSANNASKIVFDCSRRLLKHVPDGITCNVTVLDLSLNDIKNISKTCFSELRNLTVLNLNEANKNKLVTIDSQTFKNLTKLHTLKLSGNCLTKVPDNLPVSLRNLELNNNKFLYLDRSILSGLTNVTSLWLSKNCFSWNRCNKTVQIMNDSFGHMTKLQKLDLSFNNLTCVPKNLPQSLLMLNLASNRIEYISEDDLIGLHNLKTLKIQGNCPRCQNAPFPCVPCKNKSLHIHPNAFYSLTKLQSLNLGGNSLDHLKSSWFEKLSNLKELFLAFNFLQQAITGEAKFLKNLHKLEKLDLSFNFALKSYPLTLNLSSDFSSLVSLRTLHLQALVFQTIGPHTLKPLYGLKNLSALNLGTNFIIQFTPNIFSNFHHLKMIYLAENRLYPISVKDPPHPNNGYSERSRDLSISPLIKSHPKDFAFEISHSLVRKECFDSGRVLILSSNNLFFISPEQLKVSEDIACLNLSGNGFSVALNGTEFTALPNLTYLDLSYNKIDLAYNHAFQELQKLQVLDLSHNAHYFKAYGVTHNLNFTQNLPVLRVLNMSYNGISTLTTKHMSSKSLAELQFQRNYLGTLWKKDDRTYWALFTNLTNLTILDISYNNIARIPAKVYDHLPRNLTKLRISHNRLVEFLWEKLKYFHQLQILDLSYNYLSDIMIKENFAHSLSLLDLSHNHIFHLDNGFLKGANSLKTLSLSNNKLTIVNQSTFSSTPENHIQTLYLQKNPFQCTCDSLNFILWIERSPIKIPRLTTDVKCDTPANHKPQVLIFFDIEQCVNDSQAFLIYILTSSFIIIFMIVTTIAHLFYWDASYVLHYWKAKLNGYQSFTSPDSVYDVFVTYDTTDPHVSEWVMGNLRVKLEEEGEKHLPLCLEERDWPPGVPLVDNLTQSIRYSRKTLFVLTEGYVKTGVFKLAMYLAHQRLLDENMDVIVLLMLEDVLQHSHFLRLRRRLCGKSVVEWPKTAAAEPWFWQNLRSVVRVDNEAMYNKTYLNYFTSR